MNRPSAATDPITSSVIQASLVAAADEMFAVLNLEQQKGELLATTSGAQEQLRPLSVAEQPRLCPTLWETP